MKTIAMFNNKGGVGKTTLTCNIASYFAKVKQKRVLVVDCDPQCNATQLIMGQDYSISLYWDGATKEKVSTIRDVLRPIEDGDASIDKDIRPILGSRNRFGVDVIAGHPGFSIVEDRLGQAWHDLLGGDIGGIRKTNWNTELIRSLAAKYDYVFYDLGPSLGSINRSVLVGCSYFLTPMGTDIFSILGIKNIASWIKQWLDLYRVGMNHCESRTPGRLGDFNIRELPVISKGFIGYTIQQYITKSKQGVRRPTLAYEKIINGVPYEIGASLGQFYAPSLTLDTAKLGDVPHLYSLIPRAQSVAAPIFALQKEDQLVGSQYKQSEEYKRILTGLVENLESNLEAATQNGLA
jgi:cellulose biosynthesis protein BcsQ